MMKYKNIEFQWSDLYTTWMGICKSTFPNILESIEARDIKVNNYPRKSEYFFGYDWVFNTCLEKRIDIVSNRVMEFVMTDNILNKGTLQTLEHLVNTKDDVELLSAIWIYAYTKDLLENLPYEWRGDSFQLVHSVNTCLLLYLRGNDIYWHHAMKRLLPDTCISSILLSDLKPTDEYVLLELVAINASYILSNYTILRYDSREKNK